MNNSGDYNSYSYLKPEMWDDERAGNWTRCGEVDECVCVCVCVNVCVFGACV